MTGVDGNVVGRDLDKISEISSQEVMSMVFKGGPDGMFEQINGLCPSKPLPIPLGLQRQDAARDLPVEAADSEVVPTQIRPSGYESMP